MNINYFKEFAALAETRNYWEASERLFLNQSTLSKHIKAMEAELGVPLFTRTTRRVELTEFGQALLPYARSITKLQFEYSTVLLQKKNYHKSLVTMGSIPTMAQYHITDLLLEFQKTNPSCHVKMLEDDTKILKKLLMERTCEMIFLRETKSTLGQDFINEERITRIPYIVDYLVTVLPKEHPLAKQKEVTLRELKDENFCFIKENSTIYELCRSACQEADFIPNIVFDSHRIDSILDMVTKGDCTALLMNKHVEYPFDSMFHIQPGFSVVRINPAISTQISLCYLKDVQLSETAQKFVEYFISWAQR